MKIDNKTIMPCGHMACINAKIYFKTNNIKADDLDLCVVEMNTDEHYILVEKLIKIDGNFQIIEFTGDIETYKIFGNFYIKCMGCGAKHE